MVSLLRETQMRSPSRCYRSTLLLVSSSLNVDIPAEACDSMPFCLYIFHHKWRAAGSLILHGSYIEVAAAAKEGDQSTAALPYHFVFYLHPAHAQQQTLQSPPPRATTPHTESLPDGLHKISLTLPPPARKDYAQPDQLPLATQASIGRLLSACGLQRWACQHRDRLGCMVLMDV